MKNIFAGNGLRQEFVNIIYRLLMKRSFVSYADVFAVYYGKKPEYYKAQKLSAVSGYNELKKAFSDIVGRLKPYIEDNGVAKGGKAYRYVGKDDDPLTDERRSVVQKTIEDYVLFCKASVGMFPTGWFSSFFENTQILLDLKKGKGCIGSTAEQTLANIELLPVFYNAIATQKVVAFRYKPFTLDAKTLVFHSQFLKEYNGRWFVLGKAENEEKYPFVAALDRIVGTVEILDDKEYSCAEAGLYEQYFKDIVGVTHEKGAKLEDVVIRTLSEYQHGLIMTKPLHQSQRESQPYDKEKGYGEISLDLEPNREFIGRVLTFGAGLEVVAPSSLREKICGILLKQIQRYKDEE